VKNINAVVCRKHFNLLISIKCLIRIVTIDFGKYVVCSYARWKAALLGNVSASSGVSSAVAQTFATLADVIKVCFMPRYQTKNIIILK